MQRRLICHECGKAIPAEYVMWTKDGKETWFLSIGTVHSMFIGQMRPGDIQERGKRDEI